MSAWDTTDKGIFLRPLPTKTWMGLDWSAACAEARRVAAGLGFPPKRAECAGGDLCGAVAKIGGHAHARLMERRHRLTAVLLEQRASSEADENEVRRLRGEAAYWMVRAGHERYRALWDEKPTHPIIAALVGRLDRGYCQFCKCDHAKRPGFAPIADVSLMPRAGAEGR